MICVALVKVVKEVRFKTLHLCHGLCNVHLSQRHCWENSKDVVQSMNFPILQQKKNGICTQWRRICEQFFFSQMISIGIQCCCFCLVMGVGRKSKLFKFDACPKKLSISCHMWSWNIVDIPTPSHFITSVLPVPVFLKSHELGVVVTHAWKLHHL